MKTQIIALEAHDDFISVRDRMSWAKSPRILLVWPKAEKITLRAADLRILQQHASYLGAEMGVITRRGEVRRNAQSFGIPVFGSAAAAQRETWSIRPLRTRTADRKPRERAALEAMRQAARPGEAPWRSQLLVRTAFFVLGVLAVLVIVSLFVPEATITLTPASQQQTISLPVTASEAFSAASIAGNVPAHTMTVTVSASQSARVATQSSIPDNKSHGLARFTNLTQSDLTIPKGTIVYSLSPSAVQFVTLNDTHLSGNVNAMVEVPIVAAKGGAAANLPANAIQAIEGNLSLSAAVINPQPTAGGTDRLAAAPSEADRKRLHDVVVDLLTRQAKGQISGSIGAQDLLLADALQIGKIDEETYEPAAGQPGNLLKLTLRADFTGKYVKADDLEQLAQLSLNGSQPESFVPVGGSLAFKVTGVPTADGAGAVHFNLQIGRKLVRDIDLSHVNAMVRGHSPTVAAQVLRSALLLDRAPQVSVNPAWWPWLPLMPFRITVSSVP